MPGCGGSPVVLRQFQDPLDGQKVVLHLHYADFIELDRAGDSAR
jgi:hypothetical protein